jgi:hypothetical protein
VVAFRAMATRKKVQIEVSPAEFALILEALDSHLYWQCSDELYRYDGAVYDKRDPDAGTISDDPEKQAEGERTRRLSERLERVHAASVGAVSGRTS